MDGLHDLLAVQCASPLAPGRDLFVRATVSSGDHRLAVDGASGPVQAFVLDGCPETRCDPVELSAPAPARSATLSFASGGSVVVAVRLLEPQDAGTVAVTLERTPSPPGPDDSGGCAAGSGRGAAFALVLAILALGRIRRRAGAPPVTPSPPRRGAPARARG